jgi:hypothetical protein
MAYPEAMKGDGTISETVQKIATDVFFSAIEVTRVNDVMERNKVTSILESSRMKIGFGA